MSLAVFPHRPAAVVRAATKPRFRFNDEVRVGGDSRVAVITGFRSPRPHLHEVLIAYADGCSCWVAERSLRAARARLELLAGGAA